MHASIILVPHFTPWVLCAIYAILKLSGFFTDALPAVEQMAINLA
jgi:hypothetical protein